MQLVQFSEDMYKHIRDKKICCVEKSLSYINELCDRFEVLDQIVAVVDENTKNCGVFQYRGKNLQVFSLEHLTSIDAGNTVILITSDYYREYYEKLCRLLVGMDVKNIYFFANQETKYELSYRKQYENESLKDIIVFRSGPHASAYVKGMDFSDNARALFEYLLNKGYNQKYELVWLVKNPKEFIRYKDVCNVSFIAFEGSVSADKKERDKYYYALCLAKYLFFTDAYGFARNCRADQVRVQLWHGCGFKTRLNFTRCEKRYEYMTVTSELYANIHAKVFGLRDEQMLVTGCAKEDWLFQAKEEWKKLLDIPEAKKYIFWLPTYRFSEEKFNKPKDGSLNENTGLPLLYSNTELAAVNQRLSDNDIVLIIKIHPFQDKNAVKCQGYSNIVVVDNESLIEKDIQINQLLGYADALISDYSSVAVDYILLDRPMAFAVEDAEEYKNSRGFVFDNISEWLPGKTLFSCKDMCGFIQNIAEDLDAEREKRGKLLKLMHHYPTGSSCRRMVEALGINMVE